MKLKVSKKKSTINASVMPVHSKIELLMTHCLAKNYKEFFCHNFLKN